MTILVHDHESAAHALARNLDPPMRAALEAELALLTDDLIEWTDILLIEPRDDEEAIVREIGFSPFVDPITGLRHDQQGFEPGWDHLSERDGVFRMVFTFGSTFATILLIADPALLDLCRRHAA